MFFVLPANAVITQKVLNTTNGMHLPLRTGSTKMYIRDSYNDLARLVMESWQTLQGVFLSGTPVVGKSFFLNYFLIRMLGQGKKVLFVNMGDGVAKLYNNFDANPEEKAWVYYASDWTSFHQLADAADYVLIEPPEDSAKSQEMTLNHLRGKKFLVALSPDHETCKELTKTTESQTWLYMGPLSQTEACDMRQTCYTEVTASFQKTTGSSGRDSASSISE